MAYCAYYHDIDGDGIITHSGKGSTPEEAIEDYLSGPVADTCEEVFWAESYRDVDSPRQIGEIEVAVSRIKSEDEICEDEKNFLEAEGFGFAIDSSIFEKKYSVEIVPTSKDSKLRYSWKLTEVSEGEE